MGDSGTLGREKGDGKRAGNGTTGDVRSPQNIWRGACNINTVNHLNISSYCTFLITILHCVRVEICPAGFLHTSLCGKKGIRRYFLFS